MKPPRKAFVLAAGHGTRLRPLTFHTPKPLVPIWGRPALILTLRRLKQWGVKEVVINAHTHLDQFHRFVRESQHLGLQLELSYEPVILDTAGALRRAAWFFDDDPFWLVNGDIVFDVNPRPLLEAGKPSAPPISVLWCTDQFGPRTVELKGKQVVSFRSARPGATGTYTFCGLHLLSPRILSYIPPSGPFSIIEAYQKALTAGERVLGVSIARHYWADVGTINTYIEAHRDLATALKTKAPGADLVDPATWKHSKRLHRLGIHTNSLAVVSPDTRIERGASLTNTVVWPGAQLAASTRAVNAVIAGATLRGPEIASGAVLPLDQAGFPPHLLTSLDESGFPITASVIPFAARGSARSFFRIQHGKRSAILIRYETTRAENILHAGHTLFLHKQGISVPHLLNHSARGQWCLMEDCGDVSLLERIRTASQVTIQQLYKRVLDQVVAWHKPSLVGRLKNKSVRLAPGFTPALYRWEHELFIEHFAAPRLQHTANTIAELRRELGRVASRLRCEPMVLLHRDLQSSNIIFVGNQPVFIDYQGMRLGPAVYDVASLLADPYVSLPEKTQMSLLAYYAKRSNRPLTSLTSLFWLATVQRLCQALGAYGRLTAMGLKAFEHHIRPALILLDRAIIQTDNEPVLKSLVYKALASAVQKG